MVAWLQTQPSRRARRPRDSSDPQTSTHKANIGSWRCPPATTRLLWMHPVLQTTAEHVSVTVGQMAELPVALTIAGGREVVEVNSQAALVETTRTSSTDTIEQRRIDNLPINGRNYINFALTDSRLARDDTPSIGAAPTSGLNMSGQRARSNLVNVDGEDAVDNSVNGIRSTV